MMEFTAHNVLLPDGSRTMPENGVLLSDNSWCIAAINTLNAFFKNQPHSEIKIADLGCLEGGFSAEFARHGYQVVGVEARETNLAKCNYLQKKLGFNNLSFVKEDVRNLERLGKFDVIFCSGLLYHLDKPVSFLKTLGKVTNSILILNTHYSEIEKINSSTLNYKKQTVQHNLSELTTNEGVRGKWYIEYPEDWAPEKVETALWAAYGNPKSFWIYKKDLLQSIKTAGFDIIYEQFDFLGEIANNTFIEDNQRSMFVAIKL